jgi:hypothetical protein
MAQQRLPFFPVLFTSAYTDNATTGVASAGHGPAVEALHARGFGAEADAGAGAGGGKVGGVGASGDDMGAAGVNRHRCPGMQGFEATLLS